MFSIFSSYAKLSLQKKDAILFFHGADNFKGEWFLFLYYKKETCILRICTHSMNCSWINRFVYKDIISKLPIISNT